MDPSNNTETEDETIALKKKRARRVSFADNEITSVHIFRRDDEDSETPPGSKPSSNSDASLSENEVLGFFRDLGGESDEDDLKEASPFSNVGGVGDGDDDDGEIVDMRGSFLRPIGSPSPGGSSTAGSVASTDNDEDFPGPVSASFIRSGQFSDSAASDDNHDVTMDSTAFSLHYRSLARSDSEDLNTSTRFGIPSEEKTPSQTSTPAAPGSLMVLTKVKKQSSETSIPADVATAGRDSNEMSIVGENPPSYDYDRFSPLLDAILAEGSKDLSAVSVLVSTPSNASKGIKEFSDSWNKNDYLMAKCSVDSAIGKFMKQHLTIAKLAGASSELAETNKCSVSSPMEQVTDDFLSRKGDCMVVDASTHRTQSPDCSIQEIKESVKTMIEPQQLDFIAANNGTPLKVDEGQVKGINPKDMGHVSNIDLKFDSVDGIPIHGLTPSSLAGRKQLFLGTPDSSRQTGTLTSPSKQHGSFLFDENVRHDGTLSSIRKSISKSRTLEISPGTSSFKEGIDKLKHRLSKYSPRSSLYSGKDSESKHVDTLNAPSKEQLLSATSENKGHRNLTNGDDHGLEFAKNEGELRQHEETVNPVKDGENFHCMSADISDNGKKTVDMVAASLPMNHIMREVIQLDFAAKLMENRKDENAAVTQDTYISPVKLLDQKLSPSIEYQRHCFGELKHLDEHNESSNNGLKNPTNCIPQTVAKELDLLFSGNSEKFSSPVEDTKVNKFAQSVSKRKPGSPVRRVLPLSTSREDMIRSPIQDESTLLPSTQEHLIDSLYHNMQSLSPLGNSDDPAVNDFHQTLKIAESLATESASQISTAKKRKVTELSSDGQNIDKLRRIIRSPEVHKSWSSDLQLMLEQPDDIRNVTGKLGEQKWKNWANILKHFIGNTNQLLSPSVERLNLRVIGKLEDILVHLQRVTKCETLCYEIHSQKTIDPLNALRHKRVVEARMLLYDIAYEKAKLQLMQVKHERLLKKIQQLSCGLQESQMLRLNCTPCFSGCEAPGTQANDSHTGSGLLNSKVSSDKVTTMRQELETLDGKAKSLSKFFHTYCNMQWEPSCADIITFVHDYLKKRMSCMSIFQNLQLWAVHDFEHMDGFHKVVLNYCGYVIQRFTVSARPPSIIISNKLNYQKIAKTFPDMDSSAAFLFVLNPDTTKKRTGSRCLAEEIQITSSLLSNLLDVIEEVQLARIEIRNLIQAKFHSQSAGRLDLQLSFIDFYSGRKVKVILDMTCLNCGVYPVEVLPSQVCDPHCGGQRSLPLSLVAEITSVAENTGVGYSRIIRLCRCISQAIHTCRPSR